MAINVTRRNLLFIGGGLGAAAALTACGGEELPAPAASGSGSAGATRQIDLAAYDAIVKAGPVADEAAIKASPWASKIKQAGALHRGGTNTSPIFSIEDPVNGRIIGFDAGIADLLAHYITGGKDVAKLQKFTQVTSATRETMLQNNTVDVVVATYTITPARAEKIAFAGPYYSSGTSVQVKTSNNDIKGYQDLKGKKIATQQNSTAIATIEKMIPERGEVMLFEDNAACCAAVQQGRADAYVIDQSILLANVVKFPDLKVVGKPFTEDPYGIGLPKDDASAKEFVNGFLTKIYQSGDWKKMYDATIGKFMDEAAPTPPKLGSVAGS